jgi:predicted DNA binding CopG/RHH family protein
MMPKKSKLDREERETLESFERGEWASTHPTAAERRNFQKIARASLAKDKRINIRLPARVLEGIQLRAIEEGLPYQTLISSILYKFASGRLVDSACLPSSTRTAKRGRGR